MQKAMESLGEDPDIGKEQQSGKKRYHRHTPRQIQELEALFKQCPHPDEKQRLQLSRSLGLEPRQVKFWFQNRRTQMKTQHERADNSVLRAENEKIRCETLAICQALKSVICPNCGGPPSGVLSYDDRQRLRLENLHLREELDHLSSIVAKYIGRPFPHSLPSVDLAIGGLHGLESVDGGAGPSTSSLISPFDFMASNSIPDIEKPAMIEMAFNAVEEVVRLAQTDSPLWIKDEFGDILNQDAYSKLFPKPMKSKAYDARKEGTRDSSILAINASSLVDTLLDIDKWTDVFVTVVCSARTLRIIDAGMPGTGHGCLQLIHAEFQVVSPLVQTRSTQFLRYGHRYAEGMWIVADVSLDLHSEEPSSTHCYKLPSGIVIQEMPNGFSKVTWIEHVELEEDGNGVHHFYRRLISSGAAFGARRWVNCLERRIMTNVTPGDVGVGGIASAERRTRIMEISRAMIANFCANVTSSTAHRWATLSSSSDADESVRIAMRKTDHSSSSEPVFCAAVCFWLPFHHRYVFDFLKDPSKRHKWDVRLSMQTLQQIAVIKTGPNDSNCISLFQVCDETGQDKAGTVLLQECRTDTTESMVVYSGVDVGAVRGDVLSHNDRSAYEEMVMPSGFAILADVGDMEKTKGSVVTVACQMRVREVCNSIKLNLEGVGKANEMMSETVQRVKSALHCPSSSPPPSSF